MARIPALAGAALAGLTAHDLRQRHHAILRNFPVGHVRYLLESIGPELRQYIVTSNDEERPFSQRDQRRWVYASSKGEVNTFGFGSDNEMEQIDSLVVFKHSPFPAAAPARGEAGGGARLPPAGVLRRRRADRVRRADRGRHGTARWASSRRSATSPSGSGWPRAWPPPAPVRIS